MIRDMQDEEYEKLRMLDASISDKGQLQCELVAKYIQKKQIKATQIRCSPHLRAIQSARILSEQLLLPIKIMSNIYEIGGNHCKGVGSQGKSRSEFQQDYPGIEIDERITEEGWYSGKLKETKDEATIRAKQILEEISQLNGEKIIYISHGNILDLILGIVCDRNEKSNYYFCHQNTGVTLLTYHQNGGFKINYFNDHTHLEMYKLETSVDLITNFSDKQRY